MADKNRAVKNTLKTDSPGWGITNVDREAMVYVCPRSTLDKA